ncbi:hypothetical protein [Altererythrobacter sp. GH1-8]|uniref:hypothetical protein n=1 Tax=Altererythrobacter sp. GH1-8 TaxID=3349333 RepID=UPI00374C8FA9
MSNSQLVFSATTLLLAAPALAQEQADDPVTAVSQAEDVTAEAIVEEPVDQDPAEAAPADEEPLDIGSLFGSLFGGRNERSPEETEAIAKDASFHPLGSRENPVRAERPPGQRAYLSRLRCSNLKRPKFERRGSAGMSPYGSIVDVYEVTCKKAEPAESYIYLDMYHPGHVEEEAVPGFGITGGRKGSD